LLCTRYRFVAVAVLRACRGAVRIVAEKIEVLSVELGVKLGKELG
jgi:hypothetical protein